MSFGLIQLLQYHKWLYQKSSTFSDQIYRLFDYFIVDDTLFDDKRFDDSRENHRVDRAYDAPVGAMSFNWNSVNIFVRPGPAAGDPAQVFIDPENEYIRLKSNVKTVSTGTSLNVDRDEDSKTEGDLIIVSGKIAVGAKEQVIYKNITRPDLWAGSNLKSFLLQRGISVKGKVKAGKVPSAAKLLAEAESKPIEHILQDMNKFSNNYIAEMLTKNIAVQHSELGTITNGMRYIHEYLQKLGIRKDQFELSNPSGLTRENKMTAEDLWKVIKDMKDQFQYQPDFMMSLPIAGVDGTLKKRMKETPAERWVRAKTGFLTGVVSLAGYAGRRDGTVIPFVFMYNGNADESEVRALFDRLAILLAE